MRTSEFPYFRFSFPEFNKAQEAAIPYVAADVNLVVSFPTATGKTAIAEAAFGYHLGCSTGRCVYLSPYRSLSAEKYRRWINRSGLCERGIALSTGDRVATLDELQRARLILLTTESFDARTRSCAHKRWLSEVCCVVVDEAHLIGQKGRGGSVEVGLMRFTKANPTARIITLSATMSNAGQVARWVKSLNGKRTIKACGDWRPSKIITRFFTTNESDWDGKLRAAIERISEASPGEKVIAFVHSKRFGKELAQAAKGHGISCAFHNASLSPKRREKIEREFDDPTSGLDVLISTSTLSAGVNIG